MRELRSGLESLKKDVEALENNDKILKGICSLLENMLNKVEELQVNQEAIEENVSFIDSDLSNIQEELFEEVTLEELESYEDKYDEILCKSCKKALFIENSIIEQEDNFPCPYCGESIK